MYNTHLLLLFRLKLYIVKVVCFLLIFEILVLQINSNNIKNKYLNYTNRFILKEYWIYIVPICIVILCVSFHNTMYNQCSIYVYMLLFISISNTLPYIEKNRLCWCLQKILTISAGVISMYTLILLYWFNTVSVQISDNYVLWPTNV